MALPIIKKGDVFSLGLTKGIGFVQCIKESPQKEPEIIRILPGVYKDGSEIDIKSIVLKKELFFTQNPLKYTIRKKLITFVDNISIPADSEAPRFYRTEYRIRHEFLGWHIVDSITMQRKLVSHLSHEESLLSPWGMISIPDIVERIENNWTPIEWI